LRDIRERIAYLQGLSEGLNVNNNSKEGRILNGIINVLDDFAEVLEGMENAQLELEEYVESIDEDLNDLEEDVYDDDDDDDDDDELVELDEDDFIEVECPNCEETVCFESNLLNDDDYIEVTCPNCDEVVFTNDDILDDINEDVFDNTTNVDQSLSNKAYKGFKKTRTFDI
jgi:DNA-directed RNA polymerase subunit delta